MPGRLDGKVAVITGAGSGMGRATAELFAQEGARVLVMDRWEERAQDAAAKIGEAAVAFTGDVSQGEDVQAMYTAAVEAFGGINIIYNNAGIGGREENVRDCPEEVFDEIMAINLKGVWLGIKYGIPHLQRAGGGSIISTASVAGLSGLSGIAAYCASKGGVISLTRTVAGEFASSGIRVNCICPGAIATRIGDNSRGPEDPRSHGPAAGTQRHGAPARPLRRGQRHRPGGALPRLRRILVHDRTGARGRWRLDRNRRTLVRLRRSGLFLITRRGREHGQST